MFKTFIFALLLTAINLCGYADFTVRVIYFAQPTLQPLPPQQKFVGLWSGHKNSMQTKWKNTNTAGKHSGWSGTMPVR